MFFGIGAYMMGILVTNANLVFAPQISFWQALPLAAIASLLFALGIGTVTFMKNRQLILEAEKISKYFGGLAALNQVNLRVYAGEIVGLIGPNAILRGIAQKLPHKGNVE